MLQNLYITLSLSAIRTNSLKSGFKDGIPRLCGEKLQKIGGLLGTVWITPAYAGKSVLLHMQSTELRDHPRLCGEKRNDSTIMPPKMGSPPPMRGKDKKSEEKENA